MKLKELSIPAYFVNDTLNPSLWENDELILKVRYKLLQIAKNFIDTLKVKELNLVDITISGSNVGYNYSDYSDIDLHIIVDAPDDEELDDYYNAKKSQFNFKYDLKIKGIPVEVYVQKSSQPHVSAGIFSVLDDEWIQQPTKDNNDVSERDVKSKARNYSQLINQAIKSNNLSKAKETMEDIRRLRKAGLEAGGENSVENLAFKLLRNRGKIEKLSKYIDKLQGQELSLGEQMKISDIVKEDATAAMKVKSVNGDKAVIDQNGADIEVKTSDLVPNPTNPNELQLKSDPSAIKPGSTVTSTSNPTLENQEEDEEESDLMASGNNYDISGDPTDEWMGSKLGHGVVDGKWERSARGAMTNRDPVSFSPVHKLAESDELYKWLTIAGLK